VQKVGAFLLVGMMWGCTNPFLKNGTEALPSVTRGSRLAQFAAEVRHRARDELRHSQFVPIAQMYCIFTRWKFYIPFGINQAGSLVYIYLLGQTDISIAVPTCNSLTFVRQRQRATSFMSSPRACLQVFTAVTCHLLGEKVDRPLLMYTGILLILCGITICIWSKST
jgi:hypothetical protein